MFWKKKFEKAVAERDALRQQLEQSQREITENITRADYYVALFECVSNVCDKWHALYDERFAEMAKLRGERDEWKECAELWDGDCKRLEEQIKELKGECEEIRCAKQKAEGELERVKKELAAAEERAELWEEQYEKLNVEFGYVCTVAKQHGIEPYKKEEEV